MMYTMITYTESCQHYDRWGDLSGEPSRFDIRYYDELETASSEMAAEHVNRSPDQLNMLINGEDYENLMYENEHPLNDTAREFEKKFLEYREFYIEEQKKSKALAIEKAAREAEAKARQLAQAQKAADEAQFEALRRKLGR